MVSCTMMSFFGKTIGGIFGLLFGLPIGLGVFGLAFGVWCGHKLDIAIGELKWASKGFQFYSNNLLKDRLNKSIFSTMGFIAKADGKVDINEINIAKKFMARLGIKNAVERKMAVEAFNFGKSLSFNLDQQLQIVRTMAFANPQILQQFYTIQKEAASIDGHIDPQKQKILQYIYQRYFGTQHHQFNHPFQQPQISLSSDYKMLGIDMNSTPDVIRKAYKKMMGKYHPDRLEADGANQESIKAATEKTQAVKAAYERICEAKGI